MDDLPLVEALVSSLAEVGVQVKQWLQSTTNAACSCAWMILQFLWSSSPSHLPMLSGLLYMAP